MTRGHAKHRRQQVKDDFLDRDVERELARAWRNHGDHAARNRLVTAYEVFAYRCARDMSRGRGSRDDLRQEAMLGLMDAANRFDPDLGWRFSTYAFWWVKVRINKALLGERTIMHVGSPIFKKLCSSLRRTTLMVENRLRAAGKPFTQVELHEAVAEQLGIRLSDLERFAPLVEGHEVRLDAPTRNNDGDDIRTMADLVLGGVESSETGLVASDMRARLREVVASALNQLPDRTRKIIEARWLNPDGVATLGEISRMHGISPERVRQIEIKAFEHIARHYARDPASASLVEIDRSKREAARSGRSLRTIRGAAPHGDRD